MDEIFDRIKAVKIKRKDLFLPLIITELLGILVLVWFLRTPLTQKYFSDLPNYYAIESMDEIKQYLVKQGDFITGNTNPQAKLQILLTPDGSKYALSADSQGNFSFQIPQEVRPREYRLLIAGDESGNLNLVKNLKLRVQSNNKIIQFLNNL